MGPGLDHGGPVTPGMEQNPGLWTLKGQREGRTLGSCTAQAEAFIERQLHATLCLLDPESPSSWFHSPGTPSLAKKRHWVFLCFLDPWVPDRRQPRQWLPIPWLRSRGSQDVTRSPKSPEPLCGASAASSG